MRSGLLAPGITARTAGLASTNCSAAAFKGTPWRAATARMRATLGQDLGRGLLVFEMGAAGQHARAVRAADDDVDPARGGSRHQALQRAFVVEQRVAAGQQEAIGLRLAQVERDFERFDLVDAQAPGLDDALFAQPGQDAEGAGAGHLELRQPGVAIKVLGHVVHPDDIEVVGAEARQAVLDRAQRGVGRIIVDDFIWPAEFEQPALLAQVARAGVLVFVEDQAADLGAQYIILAPVGRQRLAEPDFGQAGAIEGRGIEVARALLPGRVDGGRRFLFRDVAEHVAEWGGAEAERTGACELLLETHGAFLGVVMGKAQSRLAI